jgi:hypothetical protein
MNKKTAVTLAAFGFVSMVGFARPDLSEANHYARQGKHETARSDRVRWNNRGDWAELRRDQGELERDRADLLRLYRRGASRAQIERKKAEIRADLREINQDRRGIWDGWSDLRGARGRYGYDSRYDNSDRWRRNDPKWWNWGHGWWNSGRDRYRHEE